MSNKQTESFRILSKQTNKGNEQVTVDFSTADLQNLIEEAVYRALTRNVARVPETPLPVVNLKKIKK